MMNASPHKYPRLYITGALASGASVTLSADQAHYLKNVLRLSVGSPLRMFNGRDGEYEVTLSSLSKKEAAVEVGACLRAQACASIDIHVFFAPIKKNRLDFLIEKAVELGATHLHPVVTERTEVRKINMERVRAQIIEAAEQCERLDVPELLDMSSLSDMIRTESYPLYAALERVEGLPHISNVTPEKEIGILIGPEGGFTPTELAFLQQQPSIVPVSLGPAILRAETAVLKMLSCLSDQ